MRPVTDNGNLRLGNRLRLQKGKISHLPKRTAVTQPIRLQFSSTNSPKVDEMNDSVYQLSVPNNDLCAVKSTLGFPVVGIGASAGGIGALTQ